jgi:UDP-N-acetylmuramoyl-L-alanyl-D-glutamate--2,6-diaminopimelate ligase
MAGAGIRELGALAGTLPEGRLHGARGPVPLSALALHTDHVVPGALFTCVRGAVHDGHAWAAVAVARGARALLVEHRLPEFPEVPQLEVPCARRAAARLARAFYGFPDRELLVVAVTGTNGKTTVTHMVDAVLRAAGRPSALLGTVGYRVGSTVEPAPLTTPDPVTLYRCLAEAAAQGLAAVVLEASSHALGQGRLEGLEVDTAVFTNLSRDHLDYHGDPLAYFAAKRRLFAPRPGAKPFPSLAVVGVDGAAGRLLAASVRTARQVVTYALDAEADVVGRLAPRPGGRAVLAVDGRLGRGEVPLPLPGRHNAQNALAAVAVALANGLPLTAAAEGLERLGPVPGRLEPVDLGQDFRVLVDFAHNPHGLECALRAARDLTAGRVLLVFGCKGGDGDQGKRVAMGRIAGRWADRVFLTTDDPYGEPPAATAAPVAHGLAAVGASFCLELDRAQAVRAAIESARPGDLVLVAGRGHEAWQPWADGAVPLDDRTLCREALWARLGRTAAATRPA